MHERGRRNWGLRTRRKANDEAMKTKELIRRLQEADPSGEVECCVGNLDILFVSKEPAYYDGRLQVLERDASKEPYYNVVGAKIVGSGAKMQIHTLSIEDALVDHPDMPVECDANASAYGEAVERWRAKARAINGEIGATRYDGGDE